MTKISIYCLPKGTKNCTSYMKKSTTASKFLTNASQSSQLSEKVQTGAANIQQVQPKDVGNLKQVQT